MATIITSKCINCGACEAACPTTAIYAGGAPWKLEEASHPAIATDIFYIVPEKCTECVGFFDHEACAAVCPVDCCVPDPENPETEAALLARAKQLRADVTFPPDFPSRFKTAKIAPPPAAAPAAPVAAPSPPAAEPPGPPHTAAPAAAKEQEALPQIEDEEIPVRCFRCDGTYGVAFRYFRSGAVLRCPSCNGSLVVTLVMHQSVADAVRHFHEKWASELHAVQEKQQRDLQDFRQRQRAAADELKASLAERARRARPPGAPRKRAGIFG